MYSAEIIFYGDDNQFCLSLSKTQLNVVKKALGLEIDFIDEEDSTITAFTDEALKRILKGEINPFELIKIKQ